MVAENVKTTLKTRFRTRVTMRNAKNRLKTYADAIKTTITRERVGISTIRLQIRTQRVKNKLLCDFRKNRRPKIFRALGAARGGFRGEN